MVYTTRSAFTLHCDRRLRPLTVKASFDVDLLTEVDDEYWINDENPELAFKQPEGRPSKITFANCYIRLLKILDFALRTIVCILFE